MYPYDNNQQQQPPPQQQQDPFNDWYRNTIQAHPERYDPAHFTEGQARNWFPLWDASSGGFRSSKVDRQGNPIQGNQFSHPDECPQGMTAFGQNQCVPVGEVPGQGGPGGGGGFGGGGFGSGYQFQAPWGANYNFPGMPQFEAPTAESMLKDPGYNFRLKQGIGALEGSAAARGVLNTGGTLQDVTKFGQDYASGEFGNIWQRAKDMYAPKLAEWQMKSGQTSAERDRAWQAFQFALQQDYLRQQMVLNAWEPQPAHY